MNVGSVGQPRDEDPRAAYGLVDTEQEIAAIRRVHYDIAAVQKKIRDAGLPEVLANRLALGV
jgi:diadenosine tetraphosphatase ApaH/serine/threonine PP2A family protein phosphatase